MEFTNDNMIEISGSNVHFAWNDNHKLWFSCHLENFMRSDSNGGRKKISYYHLWQQFIWFDDSQTNSMSNDKIARKKRPMISFQRQFWVNGSNALLNYIRKHFFFVKWEYIGKRRIVCTFHNQITANLSRISSRQDLENHSADGDRRNMAEPWIVVNFLNEQQEFHSIHRLLLSLLCWVERMFEIKR